MEALAVLRGARVGLLDVCTAAVAALPVGGAGMSAGEKAREQSEEVCPGRLAVAVQQPGFAMLIAETAALEVCGFGSSPGRRHRLLRRKAPAPRVLHRGGLGWQGFDGALTPAVDRIIGVGCAFTGRMVAVPQHRNVTRRLQEPLLPERPASLGVTMAGGADEPIVAFLRCWHRKDVGNVRGPADGAVFLALAPPLTRWSP
ncbi:MULTISPECIES: hypothetical protein [unclassified Streptomyces]|uniref:hypothetical protein n=1 Tax=unclassified Streptomyces TaxID=2593676 RepID=UPI002FF0B19A